MVDSQTFSVPNHARLRVRSDVTKNLDSMNIKLSNILYFPFSMGSASRVKVNR
jgi:hypothetical protein